MTNPVQREPTDSLMESGWLASAANQPLPVQVRRGMAVRTCDDCPAGYVAAVVVNCITHQITHLLLMQPCQPPTYRLLPVAAVTDVRDATVTLDLLPQGITTLPCWPTA